MKDYDKVFCSKKENNATYQLASGYISTTKIFFEIEQVIAKIEADGNVQFINSENKLIDSVKIPEQTGGKRVYDEVISQVIDNEITLKFPVVEWIDNYPNCDGEYDRWDTKTIGYHTIKFNLITHNIDLNVFQF